jgi:hypothetical protein
MSVTNKRLLISESRGDSHRCTPCRGKPDQHDTYASHASPHTPGVRFLRAVPIRGNLLRSRQQIWTDPLPLITDETVGKSQASVDNRLLGLSDPYQRHAISTFNTCMWGGNSSVLNRLRQGLQSWRCQLSTYHSLTFPTGGLHFPPKGPARSPV